MATKSTRVETMNGLRSCGFDSDEQLDKAVADFNEARKIYASCRTPYERTRAQVYATGNKWQIENFEATH